MCRCGMDSRRARRARGSAAAYALRLTGDVEFVRDVVQETFLRLCHAERGMIDGHIGPWLFRVCRQRALDLVRKEQRMPMIATADVNACESRDCNPREQIERHEDGTASCDCWRHCRPISKRSCG